MTIHIEGLDLAGKSTICRLLCKRLDAEHRHNTILPDGANPIYDAANKWRADDSILPEAVGWAYYGALLVDLQSYSSPTIAVVQDSTILLRSIVFHRLNGNSQMVEAFESKLGIHPRFTLSVFLHASAEVRLKRLEGRISRGNDFPDDYLIRTDPSKFYDMENNLKDVACRNFDAICVDTSRLEEDGEKERVISLIIDAAEVRLLK